MKRSTHSDRIVDITIALIIIVLIAWGIYDA